MPKSRQALAGRDVGAGEELLRVAERAVLALARRGGVVQLAHGAFLEVAGQVLPTGLAGRRVEDGELGARAADGSTRETGAGPAAD